jgi:hypothetical protein
LRAVVLCSYSRCISSICLEKLTNCTTTIRA